MKTNNLILLLFGLLFALFGFIFYWVKYKSAGYVSNTASQAINDAKQNFTLKDIILSGGGAALSLLNNKVNKKQTKE